MDKVFIENPRGDVKFVELRRSVTSREYKQIVNSGKVVAEPVATLSANPEVLDFVVRELRIDALKQLNRG